MRILYLSSWFPFPPTNGSELRIIALLRGLAKQHEVTLISFQRRPLSEDNLRNAREFLEDVHLVPWREFDPTSVRARLGFFDIRPRSVVDKYSIEMAHTIRQQISTGRFDVVVVSELDLAAYHAEFAGIPALIDDIELGALRRADGVKGNAQHLLRHRLMWAKQRAYVRRLLPRFTACTVVSEQERALLREIDPNYDAVELIPNCIYSTDYSAVRAIKEPDTLIFTGAFTYNANYEAMVWFLQEVFPLVRQKVPDVQLIITGDHAGKPLPTTENITLTGFIDDVKTAVARAAVSIVPILQGGGTRLKILEAMALRTPVISTTKGAEGLAATNGEHLLLADTPEEFAAATTTLLADPDRRQTVANKAHHLVLNHYDWNVIMPRFLALVDRVANATTSRRHFHASL